MRCGIHQVTKCGIKIGLIAALLAVFSRVYSEEIAPFRLTSVDGYVGMNYLSDTEEQGVGGGTSQSAIASLQEEIFINTHSYVYHPNFLKIDLGGGPLFVQDRVEVDGMVNHENTDLYNLTTRWTFLEQKSTPVALYYEHLNPTVSTSLTQSFIQTNTKKGAVVTVREPLIPFLITTEAFEQQSEGHSNSFVVNDNMQQVSTRISTNFGPDKYGQLYYQVNHLKTASGNPDFAIYPSLVESSTATFDGRFLFGERNQITYTQGVSANTLTYSRSDYWLEHKDFRFTPDLRVQHSDNFSSFYNYSYYNSDDTTVSETVQSGRLGVSYSDNDRLSLTADTHATVDHITGLDQYINGVTLHGNYTQPIDNMVLRLSAGITYDQNDRQASAAVIHFVGTQAFTLELNNPITLQHAYIISSSIVVRQTTSPNLVEGTDYEVVPIGIYTQIKLLHPLVDNQVFVDYDYQTGGSAKFNYLNQNYQASLTFMRNYTVYIRYMSADYSLLSEMPPLPLNSLNNTLFGVRVDQPLVDGFTVGGEAMSETQHEEVSPFHRQSYDVYLQMPEMVRITPRLSARRVRIDYANSPEDVDLHGWALQLSATPWPYTTLTAETNYEKDTGGTLQRVYSRDIVGIEWRFRQLSVRGEMQLTHEEQGNFARDRTLIRVTARRDF